MKRIFILAAAVGTLLLACTNSNADFRCRGRHVSAPCFTPVCHEVVHHAATVVTPTVTTIIQEPLPVFVFQSVAGYPNLPANVTQPAAQPQQQFQMSPPRADASLPLTDQQLDRLANIIIAKLSTNAAVTQNTLMAGPPIVAEEKEQQVAANQAIANDLGAKCASCHMTGTNTKGGLAIFDANRQLLPLKNGQPYATPERLWQRAEEGSMPPNAATDPSKRLNPETIAFLKEATRP